MKQPLSAFHMLDASTAHLTPATRQLLDSPNLEGVLLYPKGPWGWFVNVPSKEDGCEIGPEVPADLKTCMEFAQSVDCHWIVFDSDGSLIPELPTFEDEPVAVNLAAEMAANASVFDSVFKPVDAELAQALVFHKQPILVRALPVHVQ